MLKPPSSFALLLLCIEEVSYCSYDQAALASGDRLAPMLPELRSFYRMSQPGKIGRIHHLVYGGSLG